uniref:Conserved oligomeric Golgi complex subunit 3 n=1 Tax=Sphaeramia orbicularis TaxID=375764 RepID=A0A673C518_9TELE
VGLQLIFQMPCVSGFVLQLPIEDLCSLSSRSLQSPFTATVPASTEDVLLKGFQLLDMESDRIETAQQFFAWFAKLQVNMDQDESAKYRKTRDDLNCYQEQCDAILKDVSAALEHLDSLQKQYLFVSNKTGTLHEACEQLLKEQSELVDLAESIQQKLSYFNELENINTKLNSPTLSVNSEGFIPMLSKLDDCIEYVSSHPNFKDYPVYLAKFKQCLSKAMHFMKIHIVVLLLLLLPQDPMGLANADNAFTLYYVKFRAAAPKVRSLIEQIEQRAEKIPEYHQLLDEIHQCYLDQREQLLSPSITSTITDLTNQNSKDHCALVRSGCAFMVHVCQDEHQLYNEFFSKPTPKLDELLEKLCLSLYDVLRPLIIHIIHLETLSELCSILKNEMLEDHVHNNAAQLGAFDAERLVYRTHIYIQTDITGYNPMMEVRPISLQMYRCESSIVLVTNLWSLISKYGRVVVSHLSISYSWTQIDGQLFLIKHLLIMREQIAPFHTDFAIKEISLDLKKTRDAAFKILNPKAVPKFFRLNSHNAILEFLLEGTPEIKEHYIDSKKDVDRHLKFSCEQFIQQQTQIFVGNLEEFLTKVAALKTMAIQGGPTYNLAQQPWAQPAKINDIVMATYRVMKSKLPSTLQSMSLYLANRDTEFILFKPVRNNIQQVFQRLHALLQEEYSGEDLQIIACPSMEQINLLLSVNK